MNAHEREPPEKPADPEEPAPAAHPRKRGAKPKKASRHRPRAVAPLAPKSPEPQHEENFSLAPGWAPEVKFVDLLDD